MVNTPAAAQTPLHDDLVDMLTTTSSAEQDLFAGLDPADRDAPRRIGEWSAKDVLAHLAAWRAIEAQRLNGTEPADGPGQIADEDEANALIQSERASWSWDQVLSAANESIDALVNAIRGTNAETLQTSEQLVAGIGANGANHAIAHLGDVARMSGQQERYRAFADKVEEIVLRARLPQRDAGVMLYNIACYHALNGDLEDARRFLRDAFGLRPDLMEYAPTDSDLVSLRDELSELAPT
jgi:uncharacterized protein (TIGR03083 family)